MKTSYIFIQTNLSLPHQFILSDISESNLPQIVYPFSLGSHRSVFKSNTWNKHFTCHIMLFCEPSFEFLWRRVRIFRCFLSVWSIEFQSYSKPVLQKLNTLYVLKAFFPVFKHIFNNLMYKTSFLTRVSCTSGFLQLCFSLWLRNSVWKPVKNTKTQQSSKLAVGLDSNFSYLITVFSGV